MLNPRRSDRRGIQDGSSCSPVPRPGFLPPELSLERRQDRVSPILNPKGAFGPLADLPEVSASSDLRLLSANPSGCWVIAGNVGANNVADLSRRQNSFLPAW
jgi:hypothetical protein